MTKRAPFAVAQSGRLDDTFIPPSGEGAPYWKSRMPQDLPDPPLSHQVAAGQPGAVSPYWQSRRADGGVNSGAENAIFATLGLVDASKAGPALSPDSAISGARDALLGGVSSQGEVWERLSRKGIGLARRAGCETVGDSETGFCWIRKEKQETEIVV